MFDEMYFLFNLENQTSNKNNDNSSTMSSSNPAISYHETMDYNKEKDSYTINGNVITNDALKNNFIKSKVNAAYDVKGKNPYLQLLEDFDGVKSKKSLKLSSEDFVYLRDIGVMPINRLMILRRYPEGCVVPSDLNDMDTKPISTMVGWVKQDDDLLNFSVGETWVKQGSDQMLHLLLNDMISNEFGIKTSLVVPTAGWGVGFVFGFLNRLGLTDFNNHRIPTGNPNVLRESITRPFEDFGLNSTWTFNFETVYEQKYIGNVDSTVSIMDILQNCLSMGSSDVEYIGKANSKLLAKLAIANNNPTVVSAWVDLIKDVVTAFIGALQSTIKGAVEEVKKVVADAQKSAEKEKEENEAAKTDAEKKALKEKREAAGNSVAILGMGNLLNRIMGTILASTVAKYTWPIRGSIAMLTGQAATPWHITIGNPYSPLLSMNNIYVSNVAVAAKGEMMYNDIPKYLEVKVTMTQGRNMGKNEVYNMLGVEYKRTYKPIPAK